MFKSRIIDKISCQMRQEERTDNFLTNKLKKLGCDLAYYNCARMTELIRYKLLKKKGDIHPEVDKLGYEVGRALYLTYKQNSKS